MIKEQRGRDSPSQDKAWKPSHGPVPSHEGRVHGARLWHDDWSIETGQERLVKVLATFNLLRHPSLCQHSTLASIAPHNNEQVTSRRSPGNPHCWDPSACPCRVRSPYVHSAGGASLKEANTKRSHSRHARQGCRRERDQVALRCTPAAAQASPGWKAPAPPAHVCAGVAARGDPWLLPRAFSCVHNDWGTSVPDAYTKRSRSRKTSAVMFVGHNCGIPSIHASGATLIHSVMIMTDSIVGRRHARSTHHASCCMSNLASGGNLAHPRTCCNPQASARSASIAPC